MIEVHPNLFVGAEQDAETVLGRDGWFVVHAAKEPYHRRALGYSGRAAPKDHPEYLVARRPGRLILNLVDVDDVAYVSVQIVDAALDAIAAHIEQDKVLVHCNQGQSRGPTLALLYLARAGVLAGDPADAVEAFRRLYPAYQPARGMADFVHQNWNRYAVAARP